jgi:hypothetical protein
LNACLCSSPQSNLAELQSVLKNGKLRSAERDMKLFRAAILPVSFWTSLTVCGLPYLLEPLSCQD